MSAMDILTANMPSAKVCVLSALIANYVVLKSLPNDKPIQWLKQSFVGELLGVASHDQEYTRGVLGCKPTHRPDVFYQVVMKQKDHDHGASHNNIVNQFFHLISSTVFIWNFYTFYIGDYTQTAITGLLSLTLRQSGHAIFEPPCHTAESLCLGFDTRAKLMVFSTYAVTCIAATMYLASGKDLTFEPGAQACLLVTLFFVFGHVYMLSLLHSISIGLIWFIKFVTDPFTDWQIYYPSMWKVWTTPDWKAATLENFLSHTKTDGDGMDKAQAVKKMQ